MRLRFPDSLPLRVAFAALVLASGLVLSSCEKEGIEVSGTYMYTVLVPEYRARVDVHAEVERQAPRELCEAGAIYARGRYLFVGHAGEGWHVIDNADPRAPRNLAFWRVPGTSQISFLGDRAVVDSYGDVLLLDVDADLSIEVARAVPNALLGTYYAAANQKDSVLVGHRTELVTEEYVGAHYPTYLICGDFAGGGFAAANASSVAAQSAERGGSADFGTGVDQAGSFSRFAVAGETLYALENGLIHPVGLRPDAPSYEPVYVSFDIETVVARDGYLYLGAASGMHVLDLAEPGRPVHVATYAHVTGCDPVAVEGDRAVVTVRDGRDCNNDADVNVLIVLDISDPTAPRPLHTRQMRHPHGVALRGDRVYVCEGDHGLVALELDATRSTVSRVVAQRDDPATDVIALPYEGGLSVLTIGPEGLRQYGVGPRGEDLEPASLLPIAGTCE